MSHYNVGSLFFFGMGWFYDMKSEFSKQLWKVWNKAKADIISVQMKGAFSSNMHRKEERTSPKYNSNSYQNECSKWNEIMLSNLHRIYNTMIWVFYHGHASQPIYLDVIYGHKKWLGTTQINSHLTHLSLQTNNTTKRMVLDGTVIIHVLMGNPDSTYLIFHHWATSAGQWIFTPPFSDDLVNLMAMTY